MVVPAQRRAALGEVFAAALRERDPATSECEVTEAREGGDDHPEIPSKERLISLGCAIQNMLLCAHADGFGSGLVSGQALQTVGMRQLLALRDNERAVCFVAAGTAQRRKPVRPRPSPEDFVTQL